MRLLKRQRQSDRRLRPSQESGDSRSVFSYYGSAGRKKTATSPERSPSKALHRRSHLANLPIYLATAAILVSFFYMLGLTTNPKIILNEPEKGQLKLNRGEAVYYQTAQSIMKSSVLNRSKLTIDTAPLEAAMSNRFAELGEVQIDISLFRRRPFFYLSVAPARLALINAQGQTYVINDQGRAVMRADEVKEGDLDNLPAVTDQSGLSFKVFDHVLRERDVEYVRVLSEQLKAKQLNVASFILPPAASQLDMRLHGQPYAVKFNLELDPRQSVGAFLALKEKLAGERTSPAEYIDVRVEDRAYFK